MPYLELSLLDVLAEAFTNATLSCPFFRMVLMFLRLGLGV